MDNDTLDRQITRRSFLRTIGWGSFFAAVGISIVGAVRFLFPRVLFEKPSVFFIGYPDEFRTGKGPDPNSVCQVYENWKAEQSVWIVREQDRIYAIHSSCTHLGCTPNWFADEGIFKCPCHGSQFKSNGMNFAGPAPRPLDRFHISLGDDGRVLVDKSRLYTFREYDRPGAYLKI
ncbi:MAG: ubiquinol-cytochrome c reductase iron-sulfur subunit [Nitrospirota bacterium]|nr:ubiquinol-cytochrome c reductase iron-sulfur subunit [Nitrospirota bacterium]